MKKIALALLIAISFNTSKIHAIDDSLIIVISVFGGGFVIALSAVMYSNYRMQYKSLYGDVKTGISNREVDYNAITDAAKPVTQSKLNSFKEGIKNLFNDVKTLPESTPGVNEAANMLDKIDINNSEILNVNDIKEFENAQNTLSEAINSQELNISDATSTISESTLTDLNIDNQNLQNIEGFDPKASSQLFDVEGRVNDYQNQMDGFENQVTEPEYDSPFRSESSDLNTVVYDGPPGGPSLVAE